MSPWRPQEWQEATSLLALLALWLRSPLKRLFIDLHSPALETDGPQTFEGRSTRTMASSSSWCCFPSVNPWIVFLRLVLSRGLAGQEDAAPATDPLCAPTTPSRHPFSPTFLTIYSPSTHMLTPNRLGRPPAKGLWAACGDRSNRWVLAMQRAKGP